jgi:hypothetical protein
MAITLAELRTQARQRADQEDSNFVSDSELTSYINNSIAELHDILIQAYSSDYYLSEYDFNTVAGQAAYDLPADFYKVLGVDVKLNNSDFFTIKRFNFNERNKFDDFGVWSVLGITAVRYRVMGSQLRFTPIPDDATAVKLWYIPLAEKLVADADELSDLNAYSEYVIVDAAIKMMAKEESDPTILIQQKAALKRRIEEAANNRDAANPDSVRDIYGENSDYFFGRTRGR